jgi:hypothetical protein
MEAGGLNAARDWGISIYPILDLVGSLGRKAKSCGLTEGNSSTGIKGEDLGSS